MGLWANWWRWFRGETRLIDARKRKQSSCQILQQVLGQDFCPASSVFIESSSVVKRQAELCQTASEPRDWCSKIRRCFSKGEYPEQVKNDAPGKVAAAGSYKLLDSSHDVGNPRSATYNSMETESRASFSRHGDTRGPNQAFFLSLVLPWQDVSPAKRVEVLVRCRSLSSIVIFCHLSARCGTFFARNKTNSAGFPVSVEKKGSQ